MSNNISKKVKNKGQTFIVLTFALQIFILSSIFLNFYKGNYPYILSSIGALIVSFVPLALKKKLNLNIPNWVIFLIVLSLGLNIGGQVNTWYLIFYPFYDKICHFVGSSTIAVLGFLYVISINKSSKIKLKNIHIFFFVILFTVALGAFWEIMEFTSDNLFLTNAQHGLNDTMYDMIFNFVGSLVVSVIALFSVNEEKKNAISNSIFCK